MKDLYQKYKTYFLFGLVALVAIGAYFFFFSGDDGTSALVSERPAGEEGDGVVGRDLLEQLLELRSLRLDESVFSDPVFRNLRDFGQTLSPQPKGRNNPFAPLGDSQSQTP